MIYLLHVALAGTMFLVVLNHFLQGTWKARIDAVLSLFLLGFLATAFIVFGWLAGALAILLCVVYGSAFRSVASRLAVRLLGLGGDAGNAHMGPPPRALERISRELGRELSIEELSRDLANGSGRRARAEATLLDYCTAQPALQTLIQEYGADRTVLEQLYRSLCMAGAGQWLTGHYVAASALAYPHSLRFLLAHRNATLSHEEQAFKIMEYFERGSALD